ncbi:MAG: polysaccharide export protein [Gammaproteobacteria bacterium]|nr:polysaccharide export protein [Gemmatimonadota bacterium]NIR84732.1 polysaccharide export protein [Gammaproteobacteria bacterium]NIU05773.1 polysaccharide export protein [Gammaproteobacteria bacterium]NIV52896.1 polysaccharide export protein [Gammaproteobacteria bacterium]NIX87046.1 polysaccharide export protein [Gammaproteobacteria bacterium]
MRTPRAWPVCAVLLLFAGATAAADDSGSGRSGIGYRIQPGDVLHISVWKEEGLDREVVVRPDGGISFPLAGDLDVEGKAVPEVRSLIAERISRYVPDPTVTVALQQAAGNKIYVIGQVQRPSAYSISRPADVMQALSMAGGMTPFSDTDDILILRRAGGEVEAIPFDYSAVAGGEDLEQNILLEPGDVVVVP